MKQEYYVSYEKRIFSIFSNIMNSIGYSEVHGRIIAALLINKKPLSLDELKRKTGYSLGSISLSLDLLEFFGIIKKFREFKDRKLYVKLDGDLISGLKSAILLKIKKNIDNAMDQFRKYKKIRNKKLLKSIERLEKEVKRLEKYVEMLSNVKIPK